jgi:hypothetical protein
MVSMPGATYGKPLPDLREEEDRLRRSLQEDLHHLSVEIGERNLKHPEQLFQAERWIAGRLQETGLNVERQTFASSRS